ncbi:MAG: pyridoxine 5'-phosphate synthase [Bacteroidales bacterium]|jgi:pyridoxine 5-phosphate synthase|nr:pyridoxine 5'-phosphate synthase [Bacteroidales bacterium]
MTRLSVNINKIATLRNARGGNNPDLIKVALDCERFGAQGITVHPRPDERHIRKQDVYDLKKVLTTEFNIEGYPDERLMKIVEDVCPAQVTLVPDSPNQLTSNHGWNTIEEKDFLIMVISRMKKVCRVSVFVDADVDMIKGAKECGADRVELYTESYARDYIKNREQAIEKFVIASNMAKECGLGLNAGHDLSLENLEYFIKTIPFVDEVSIGHALICDSIYYGLKNTIELYLRSIKGI